MKDLKITDDTCHKVLGTQELLVNIFCSVPIRNIFKMRLVCRLWNDILQGKKKKKNYYFFFFLFLN
jgi:hypothetical protein